MKLSEMALIVGVPVGDLSHKAITKAEKEGRISSGQAKSLMAELSHADRIWQSGGVVAKSLW